MQTRHDESETEELRNECRQFTHYLLGQYPDAYVLGQYLRLQPAAMKHVQSHAPVDTVLLRTARSSLRGLRIADAYARIFRPRCLLRRKLILTFAILENSGAFYARFTSGASSSLPLAAVRVAVSVMGFALALTASLFVIAPLTVLAGRKSRTNDT